MRPFIMMLSVVALGACASSNAAPSSKGPWIADQSTDKVTGETRFVVSAQHKILGASVRSGAKLYATIEEHRTAGLMVGVASGGNTYRVPVGEIIWRVDENEVRELKVSDTPATGSGTVDLMSMIDTSAYTPEQLAALKQSQALTNATMSAIQNGVTMAGGTKAQDMLAELRSGTRLRFRTAQPDAGMTVRQNAGDQYAEVALDESLDIALETCGIG